MKSYQVKKLSSDKSCQEIKIDMWYKLSSHKSYLVIKVREVRTAKEVKKVMAGGILSVAMFVI